jgi:hypothetical protein
MSGRQFTGSRKAKITVGVGEIDPDGTHSPVNTGIRSARLAFGFPAIQVCLIPLRFKPVRIPIRLAAYCWDCPGLPDGASCDGMLQAPKVKAKAKSAAKGTKSLFIFTSIIIVDRRNKFGLARASLYLAIQDGSKTFVAQREKR